MKRVAEILIDKWWLLLGLVLGVTGIAAWFAVSLEFDLAFRHFVPSQAEDDLALELSRQFGGQAGSHLVAILHADDVFRPDALEAIGRMSQAIADIPNVDRVLSLSTAAFIQSTDDDVSFDSVLERYNAGADPAKLRVSALASPLYVRRLISGDGQTTGILALLDPEHRSIAARAPTIAAFKQAIRRELPRGMSVWFTGYPISEAEYARSVLIGFALAQVIGLTLMASALYLMFRTISAVLLPLVTVGIATIIVMGIIAWTGQRLTYTNASVPLMMLVIGVSEVSFFVSRLYEEAETGWDEGTAERATESALWPGFIASCTTSAGFVALGSGHIGLTREFGYNMAIAGLITFVVAAVLIPGALARLGKPSEEAIRQLSGGWMSQRLAEMTLGALERRRVTWLLSIAIVVFGVAGIPHIARDQYATRELPDSHPIQLAQKVVDQNLAGAFQTSVAVMNRDGSTMMSPLSLKDVEALEAFLATQPDVIKTWSVADYLKELHAAIERGDQAYRTLPDDSETAAQYLAVLESGRHADMDQLINADRRAVSIVIGTTDLGTARLRVLRDRADAFIRESLGNRLRIRFVGDYWEVSRGTDILAADQLVAVIGSFALILPLVGILLRSWRLTLLCIPANVLPLLATLGIMGVFHFDLRTGTSIVLPVTVGIAIDMTTHLVSRAREEWRRDGNLQMAVERSLRGTGWGIASTTLALVMGFAAYQVPPFRSFNDIGILASVTMVAALFANLFLMPALILQIRPFGKWMPSTPSTAAG